MNITDFGSVNVSSGQIQKDERVLMVFFVVLVTNNLSSTDNFTHRVKT